MASLCDVWAIVAALLDGLQICGSFLPRDPARGERFHLRFEAAGCHNVPVQQSRRPGTCLPQVWMEGVHRAYPGRHLESGQCDTYEPRHRQWWNAAISVRKSLVVLLDNGASMGRLAGASPPTSTFALGQRAVLRLLPTLTAADEVSVAVFNGNGALLLNSNRSFVVPGTGLQPDNEDLVSLSNAVNGATLSESDAPSDIVAGMQQALSILRSAAAEALKVVIVLTDGQYGNDLSETPIQQVVQDVLQENVKVLTSALGQGAATQNLTALACAMRGSFETLDTPLNPPLRDAELLFFSGQVPARRPRHRVVAAGIQQLRLSGTRRRCVLRSHEPGRTRPDRSGGIRGAGVGAVGCHAGRAQRRAGVSDHRVREQPGGSQLVLLTQSCVEPM